jgi:hypothetical protein
VNGRSTSPSEQPWEADLRTTYPAVARILKRRWITAQAGEAVENRAPLYRWLEGPDDATRSGFLDALVAALESLSSHAGLPERLDRLRADQVGFWSALTEIFLAAHLDRSGVPTTLHPDTPDLRAHVPGHAAVGIEITAGFPTLSWSQFYEAIAATWDGPGTLVLLCPDESVRFLVRDRDTLLDRLRSLDRSVLELPDPIENLGDDYRYRDESFGRSELRVPTSDIIDPGSLEIFWNLDGQTYVASRSGARWGYKDPWPDVVDRADEKARKLPRDEVSIVAIEGGFLHPSTHIWAQMLAEGHIEVGLVLDAYVAGLMVYWQDVTRLAPSRPIFVWNRGFTADRTAVAVVLDALGVAAQVESVAQE